jgi:hypothetical protein
MAGSPAADGGGHGTLVPGGGPMDTRLPGTASVGERAGGPDAGLRRTRACGRIPAALTPGMRGSYTTGPK